MFWLTMTTTTAVVVVVVVALCVLNWLINNGKGMDKFKRIRGPVPYPIVGNMFEILADRVKLFYLGRKFANEYKDLYKFSIPLIKVINIYNPEDIESDRYSYEMLIYIFGKEKKIRGDIGSLCVFYWLYHGEYSKELHDDAIPPSPFYYRSMRNTLEMHPHTVDIPPLRTNRSGAKWHSRRKILTPAFHFNILRHFSYILEENSWKMVRDLEQTPLQDKTNITPLISAYTLHSICETAMGTKLDEEKSGAGLIYKNAIHEIGSLLVQRFSRLWLIPDLLFKMSITGRQHDKVLNKIKSFPKNIINERREYHEKYGDEMYVQGTEQDDDIAMKSKKKMAMLDLLLTAEKKGLIDTEGVQEEVDTFMFEGHDTTAMGLVFNLMLLANHTDIQDKIVKECKSIFGESDRPATMSDLQEMKYLECCVKEGLRLYPPVPFISRQLGEDIQLKDFLVPANTLCHVHIYDLHRRADLFKEPLQFIPERFLTDYGDTKHPYAYIPFSAGPRNCIGQKFALLEMKSAISAILRTYELRPVTKPEDIVIGADLVLRPLNPIYVKFVKRTE